MANLLLKIGQKVVSYQEIVYNNVFSFFIPVCGQPEMTDSLSLIKIVGKSILK
jgi:hypothetical protein